MTRASIRHPLHSSEPVGALLRQWRDRRRLSQLDLALSAGVSARHVSFIETGRSKPTSAMIERLAEPLDIPLRERNRLLLAGGYAPRYPEDAGGALEPGTLGPVRAAVRQVLEAHAPFPALAVNGIWEIVEANAGVALLTEGCAPALLEPPINALRVSLHPEGAAGRIANLAQWREHVLARLARQARASASPVLGALLSELRAYGAPSSGWDRDAETGGGAPAVAVPLRLRHPAGELAFLSVTSVFGAPMDIMIDELAIESFLPADEHTAQVVRSAAAAG